MLSSSTVPVLKPSTSSLNLRFASTSGETVGVHAVGGAPSPRACRPSWPAHTSTRRCPQLRSQGAPGDELASAQDSLHTQKASSGVPRNTDKGGPVASFLVPATSPNSQPSMLNDDREGEGMVGGPEFLSLGPTYPWGSRRRAWWDVSASRSETEQRPRRLTWTACLHVRATK